MQIIKLWSSTFSSTSTCQHSLQKGPKSVARYGQLFLYNKSYQEDNATGDGSVLELHRRHLLRGYLSAIQTWLNFLGTK